MGRTTTTVNDICAEHQQKTNIKQFHNVAWISATVLVLVCTGSVVGMVWNFLQIDDNTEEIDVLKSTMTDLLSKVEEMEEYIKLQEKQIQRLQKIKANVTRMDQTFVSTSMTALPTSGETPMTTTSREIKTNQIPNSSFVAIKTQVVTYSIFEFLAVQVEVPSDGLSTSENWCRDYQHLCEHFSRRPTGCSTTHRSTSPYQECREEYNSDMSILDVLGCNPSSKIATVSGLAFPEARNSHNTFGFFKCGDNNCKKSITADNQSLAYMRGFLESNNTILYTVCR